MSDAAALRSLLGRIDGRGYKAYKELRGAYTLGPVTLQVDHVQGDPFAAPSRMRVQLAADEAALPPALFESRVRRIALEDFLARSVRQAIREEARGDRGSGKSGLVAIDAGRQEILERSAMQVTPEGVEARLEVGLPAAGRRVLGREAQALLLDELPRIAEAGLRWKRQDREAAHAFVACAEDHAHLAGQLEARGLVGFVADGALLPRESGASDRPLRDEGVAFEAPDALRVTLELPVGVAGDAQRISGLGIPQGVTLIVGGGYHGKSTLLHALERGVYAHVPGDGREQVATLPSAVKIRAEDGRRVAACDISAFIGELPQGRSTERFDSEDASGSTSQAANIVEAIEVGARVLLLDEDTSATNFMIRDARMQALVHRDREPITPFVDRVRDLYETHGVSSVLVMGGCGDYFDVADTVIEMRSYRPHDASEDARRVAARFDTKREPEARRPIGALQTRVPRAASLDPSRGRREVKIDARGTDGLGFGTSHVDLRAVEQLVDPSQTRALGWAMHLARERFMGPGISLHEVLDALDAHLDAEGLDALDRRLGGPGGFARPRRFEIAAALNRLRTLRIEASGH